MKGTGERISSNPQVPEMKDGTQGKWQIPGQFLWHKMLLQSRPYSSTGVTTDHEVYHFTVVQRELGGLQLNSFPDLNKQVYINYREP